MRESLQDGSLDHIHLQRTRADQTCVHTQRTIPEGRHAISLQNHNYIVWLSVAAVDELVAMVDPFDPDADQSHDLNVRNRYSTTSIRYISHLRNVPAGDCPACGENVKRTQERFEFTNPVRTSNVVAVHEECLPRFVDALERVWNHPELLAEHV